MLTHPPVWLPAELAQVGPCSGGSIPDVDGIAIGEIMIPVCADSPTNVMLYVMFAPNCLDEAAAVVPVSALPYITLPTKPVAASPVVVSVLLATAVPTEPVAALPVSALPYMTAPVELIAALPIAASVMSASDVSLM